VEGREREGPVELRIGGRAKCRQWGRKGRGKRNWTVLPVRKRRKGGREILSAGRG
jgi:hypothetical protein